jgi:hypothetical protein
MPSPSRFIDVGPECTFRIKDDKITWSATADIRYHKSAIRLVRFHEDKAWQRFKELRDLRESLEQQEALLLVAAGVDQESEIEKKGA